MREILGQRLSATDRLRWLVLKHFRVLPGSAASREATEADIIFAGLNMALDLMKRGGGEELNPAFDEARFYRLREGGGDA